MFIYIVFAICLLIGIPLGQVWKKLGLDKMEDNDD